MFNAQVIGPGPTALLESLQSNIQTMFQSIDLAQARGYVIAVNGTPELGRVQPANIAIIAGGSVDEIRLIHRELGRTLAQAEDAERDLRIQRARTELLEKMQAPTPSYDDYLREEATTSVEEPKGPLEALAEHMGFRIVHGPDGRAALRCNDYPNCACGD